MIDPISLAVNETIKSVRDHIRKAEQSRGHTIQRCENYLDAARSAINGLVTVFDEILVKAESCDLDDPQQVKALRDAIRHYANVDRIRPELRQAIRGIGNCHDDIERIAAQSMQLPADRQARARAVANLRRLLRELTRLLTRLESHGLQHLPAGTGIGIRELHRIVEYIDDQEFHRREAKSQRLAQLVKEIREERLKDELWPVTDQIVDTINELYHAFR